MFIPTNPSSSSSSSSLLTHRDSEKIQCHFWKFLKLFREWPNVGDIFQTHDVSLPKLYYYYLLYLTSTNKKEDDDEEE